MIWLKVLFIYLVLINSYGLLKMYADKRRARHRKQRWPERSIWRLAIIGGAFGIWTGMGWFRHKTQKRAFKYGIPIVMVVEFFLLIIGFWLTRK